MSLPALSIRQPWAWAICAGHKNVENRWWKTSHRGWFVVHAGGRSPAAADIAWIRDSLGIVVPADLARGALSGVARLDDIVECSDSPTTPTTTATTATTTVTLAMRQQSPLDRGRSSHDRGDRT
jgi:hypothetical protein